MNSMQIAACEPLMYSTSCCLRKSYLECLDQLGMVARQVLDFGQVCSEQQLLQKSRRMCSYWLQKKTGR